MAISTKILSLCSGYGGLDLGIQLHDPTCRVVCYVEQETYAASNLVARMEDKTLHRAPIWDNVKTFDGSIWRGTVGCITAGYPCQPFSLAGNQKGIDDPRHLWPDIKRIVGEIQPRLCFFENVPNHLNLGFNEVARDLQEMGYSVAATLVTAEEIGAPHKRERLFILANCNRRGLKTERSEQLQHQEREALRNDFNRCSHTEELAVTESQFRGSLRGRETKPHGRHEPTSSGQGFPPRQNPEDLEWSNWPWPSFEPGFRRGAYGVTKWNNRLRLCGNGVVPLAAAYAFGILSHDLKIYREGIT